MWICFLNKHISFMKCFKNVLRLFLTDGIWKFFFPNKFLKEEKVNPHNLRTQETTQFKNNAIFYESHRKNIHRNVN